MNAMRYNAAKHASNNAKMVEQFLNVSQEETTERSFKPSLEKAISKVKAFCSRSLSNS